MPSLIEHNILNAQKIRQEGEELSLKHQLEQETKRRIAEEYVNKKSQLIDGFLNSTVSALRKYIGEFCDNLLESISKSNRKNKIQLAQVKSIKKTIAKVSLLNFYDDKEIEQLLNQLSYEVDKFKGERNDDLIINKLQEIVDVSTKQFEPENFNPAIDYLAV